MDRKVYHVTKSDQGWEGKLEGGQRASVTGTTKQETVDSTIELAKKQPMASVIIHKEDGTVQEERTFPRSTDPNPPKG